MRRNVLNITASDVKDAKLTATVTIPAADVDAAIKKAYKDTAKKYRFPGFRAGDLRYDPSVPQYADAVA